MCIIIISHIWVHNDHFGVIATHNSKLVTYIDIIIWCDSEKSWFFTFNFTFQVATSDKYNQQNLAKDLSHTNKVIR